MRSLLAVASISVVLVTDAGAQAVPTSMVPLQAEVETVYSLRDGTEVRNKGNFYRSRTGQIREDSSLGAVIADIEAGTITILIADAKEARVLTIPPNQRRRSAQPAGPSPEVFERTTVDGRRVSKARTKGPQGQNVEFWTADEFGVIIRTRTETAGLTATRELRKISTVEPAPDLFAIPAGYTVLEQNTSPAAAPQQVLPGQRGAAPPPRTPGAPPRR